MKQVAIYSITIEGAYSLYKVPKEFELFFCLCLSLFKHLSVSNLHVSFTWFTYNLPPHIFIFWLLNLLTPSGFFTYHQGLTFKNSTWCSLWVECFVRISEQTATSALYIINWWAFVNVVESVYCAVRTVSLYRADYVSSLKG